MSPQPSPVRRFHLEDTGEAGSLVFGEASSPLTIPKALIAKIWGQVEEGVRIVPRGGAEVGGLLVGPKSRSSSNGVVVDGIVPLSIEYEHGPAFRMSASDLAKMAALVDSVQVDPSKAVVGFYRSQTRGDETFRDSDREIFDAIEQTHMSFTADFLCYFVLSPVTRSEMLTYISRWNGQDWDGMQFTLRSNPFSIVQAPSFVDREVTSPAESVVQAPSSVVPEVSLTAEVQVGHAEASLVPTVLQAVPQLATEQRPALIDKLRPLFYAVLSSVKAAAHPSNRLYAAAGLLVLAGAVGGYRWIVRDHPEPTVVPPLRLGFSANREGPVWKLSWDRGAMKVMKARGAVLAIKDGSRNQQLILTPSDLSSGTIFYTPRGGDLVFSLQLERGDAPPIEEYIRVLDGPRGVQKSATRGPQTLPTKTAVKANVSSPHSTVPANLPRSTSSDTARETPVNAILNPNPARGETTAAPAPQGVEPNARSATSSTPSSAAAPATLPLAVVPPPVKPNYIGPKPVQQVPPERPPNVNSTGVKIQIHVQIDARGNVTNATAIGVTTENSPLVSVTERAARSWQFQPAEMNGRPVPSELDILFRF